MPQPSPFPSTYPSDDEWWDRRPIDTERKGLISKRSAPRWTTYSILCCVTILVLMVISPTVIIAIVVTRIGIEIEQQAAPLAQQAMPVIQDAHDAVRTASVATRLFHQLLNNSIMQTARIPLTIDTAIETLNETKRLASRLANMAEHPPAITLGVG